MLALMNALISGESEGMFVYVCVCLEVCVHGLVCFAAVKQGQGQNHRGTNPMCQHEDC